MALTVPSGLKVANNDPVDDRMAFDTVVEAEAEIGTPRRYDGLEVWIRSEKKKYQFYGADETWEFKPVAGSVDLDTVKQAVISSTEFESAVEDAVSSLFVWNVEP
jgi:hypothetical protein